MSYYSRWHLAVDLTTKLPSSLLIIVNIVVKGEERDASLITSAATYTMRYIKTTFVQ